MTRVYFVRHAQPDHDWEEDRTRPLTEEGRKDSAMVVEFLKDRKIDMFYSSPYKRSKDTIADAAAFFGKEIITDERLREREKGPNGNHHGMFQRRWADHDYHEEGGESIAMVQKRNMEALHDILADNADKEIVVGTHGTALSSILNFYDNSFGCDDFLRIIDWMPYVIELDFEGNKLIGKHEHGHVEKEFKGSQRADKEPIRVAAAIICDDMTYPARIFATARGYGEFKGKWEFPGGKIEAGETSQEALVREIRKELDTQIKVGELVLKEAEAARWLSIDTLYDVEWLPADMALIEKIKKRWAKK